MGRPDARELSSFSVAGSIRKKPADRDPTAADDPDQSNSSVWKAQDLLDPDSWLLRDEHALGSKQSPERLLRPLVKPTR